MTGLLDLPAEVLLRICSLVLERFDIEISYDAIIYCKVDIIPEEDSYRCVRTAELSALDLERLWFAKGHDYAWNKEWRSLPYICKTIMPFAREARLKAFDGHAYAHASLSYLSRAITRYASMPMYKDFLLRVRVLCNHVSWSNYDRAIVKLARILPALRVVECQGPPKGFSRARRWKPFPGYGAEQRLANGDYDWVLLDPIEITNFENTTKTLKFARFGHITTFLISTHFWGWGYLEKEEMDKRASLIIVYTVVQGKLQAVARYLGPLHEIHRAISIDRLWLGCLLEEMLEEPKNKVFERDLGH